MPSKPKAPALDRLVRQAMRRAERLDGKMVVICERKQLRELIQRAAAECARIADESGRFRQDAVDAIRCEFGIGEGKDG